MRRRPRRSPTAQYGAWGAALAAALALIWVVAVGAHWYLGWLVAWSGALFALYGYDKRQARDGGPRVPERLLHLMALAGGAAGGWLGMLVFRHKTRRPVFRVVLGVAVALQAGLGLWLIRGAG